MTPVASTILIIAALLTSILSGVVGMGGGVVLLGVMASVMPAAIVVPIHGVVQLGSNLTRTLVFLRHVKWRIFWYYAPFMMIGTGLATLVWSGDKLSGFKPFIGVFIICFLISRRYKPTWRNPPMLVYPLLGVCTGFLALFVGATGPFIAPFFLRDDLEKEGVIATKAVCQAAGHLMKIPAFIALGFDFLAYKHLLVALVVMVILGTLTAKKLLSYINQQTFVRIFISVLLILAVRLIVSPWF
jgi:uncharacterized membrane protein YfcA